MNLFACLNQEHIESWRIDSFTKWSHICHTLTYPRGRIKNTLSHGTLSHGTLTHGTLSHGTLTHSRNSRAFDLRTRLHLRVHQKTLWMLGMTMSDMTDWVMTDWLMTHWLITHWLITHWLMTHWFITHYTLAHYTLTHSLHFDSWLIDSLHIGSWLIDSLHIDSCAWVIQWHVDSLQMFCNTAFHVDWLCKRAL